MNRPIRLLGLAATGLLFGSALAPVAAQQQRSGIDGQVALRSDGALYVIANGQRRWVATVVLSDDDINAYPEGDPIMVGLAPAGSSPTSSASSGSSGSSNTANRGSSNSSSSNTSSSNSTPSTTSTPGTTGTPSTSSGSSSKNSKSSSDQQSSSSKDELSADIPIEVDIDGEAKFTPGQTFHVDIKTKKDATCEMTIKLPKGKEASEDSRDADTSGKCRFNIDVPSDTVEGDGTLVGTVRMGGKMNRQEVPFSVSKKK
jgi:hypothetical protein